MNRWKVKSRRELSLKLRDQCGLNALDRLSLKKCVKKIDKYMSITNNMKALVNRFKNMSQRKADIITKLLKCLILREYAIVLNIISIVELPAVPRTYYESHTFESMFAHLRNLSIGYSEKFRFQSVDDMKRLKEGFRFPTGKVKVGTYSTTSEELMLPNVFFKASALTIF